MLYRLGGVRSRIPRELLQVGEQPRMEVRGSVEERGQEETKRRWKEPLS